MKTHIYALNLDEATKAQFEHCASQDYVTKAALMSDAHAGYVAPIGSVLVTKGKVVPAWVGYDIGCGMTSAKLEGKDVLKKIQAKKQEIFQRVKQYVPMGKGIYNKEEHVSQETKDALKVLVKRYKENEHDKDLANFFHTGALRQLGSLGSGNHFIELGIDEENQVWVTVHCGSRGIGYKVAKKYMIKSSNSDTEFEATHPLDVNEQLGKEYINVLDFGLEFALLNRKEILHQVVQAIKEVLQEDISYDIWTNKNHNHAIQEGDEFIHRKGATPAKLGERGVIPGNMKDGCFLVEGLGNKDFLESSSHGAGRKMGRKEAREKITLAQFEKDMESITGTVSEKTLDEAPDAYQDIFAVMEKQKDSVKIVAHITPIINWKGE